MPDYRDTNYHVNFLAGTSGISGKPGGRIFWVGASGYVAVNGKAPSDGNNGLSPQTCFSTIQKGLDACTSGRGDTVAVLPGTYTITAVLTMTNDDVTLRSAVPVGPKEWSPVIITAAATADFNLISVDANNCVISGITFEAGFTTVTPSQEVIQLNSTNTTTDIYGAIVENCFFHMGRAAGAASASDTDLDVIRVGLDANDAAINTIVRGNTIYAYDEIGIAVSVGSAGCLIQNNALIDGVGSELGTGIVLAAVGARVDGNLIMAGTSTDTVGCVGVNVAAARAVVTNNNMIPWGAHTCGITIVNTGTLFSGGNYISAMAAGNLINYITSSTTPSSNVDMGNVTGTTPALAAFITPTKDGT